MLKVPADFPHLGSTCFIAPDGEQAKILQRNANSTVLVALSRAPSRHIDLGSASDTRTVASSQIHATVDAARGKKAQRRRKTA